MLSEEFWQERFGGDPAIVGRAIRLDGVSHTVVGILPARFGVPHGAQVARAQVWVPMRFSEEERGWRNNNFLLVMGRLQDGATPASAQAELARLFDGIVAEHPDLRGEGLRVLPLQAEGDPRGAGAAPPHLRGGRDRAADRRGERREPAPRPRGAAQPGGRHPHGAGRHAGPGDAARRCWRLSCSLRSAWGLASRSPGWASARSATWRPSGCPSSPGLAINIRIVVFAMALALLVALLAGLMPAWRGAAADPLEALRGGRGGGMGGAHHRLLGALVVAEVALSLVLLIGAGLVLRGFAGLLRTGAGVRPRPGSSPFRRRSRPTAIPTLPRCDGTSSRRWPRSAQVPGRRGGGGDLVASLRSLGLELQHPVRGPAERRSEPAAAGGEPDRDARVLPGDRPTAAGGPSPRAGRRRRPGPAGWWW